MGLGTQSHYKTPDDLQVFEAVPSRMTLSLSRDGQIAIRNFCASIFFLLSNQVVKIGNVFASDGSYVTIYDFLSAGFFFFGDCNRTQTRNHLVRRLMLNHYTKLGFPIYLQRDAELKCCLNY